MSTIERKTVEITSGKIESRGYLERLSIDQTIAEIDYFGLLGGLSLIVVFLASVSQL